MGKVSVLFVCTANVFRSVIAEYCLKKYLKDNGVKRFTVSSAGIEARPQKLSEDVLGALLSKGINASAHKQRRLNKQIIDNSDFIICMAYQQYEHIMKKYGLKSFLFNELAVGKKTSIKDTWEVVPDYKTNIKARRAYTRKVVEHVWTRTPKLVNELLLRNFLFEDFINGKANHKNGFPFIPVHETKHSVAFLSINVPKNHKWHVLVVPRKRYKDLDEIPSKILNDLINTVSLIGRVFKQSHGGYNVLLNNGNEAGQYIFHTHFHVIPRSPGDNIKLEEWKPKKITPEDFVRYSNKLKQAISRLE